MEQIYKDLLQAWIGAVVILSIYSFLYNDNRIYRIILNTCIGIGTGYALVITWKQVIAPLWWDKMWGNIATAEGGTWFAKAAYAISHNPGAFTYWLILGVLGSLWYFQASRKYMWLSRIVIGITLGANAGIIFKDQLLNNVPQVIDSVRPIISSAPNALWPNGQPWIGSGMAFDPWQTFSNIVFLIGIVTVMVYFLFSFDHSNTAVKKTAGMGRWLLMILFGGFFGNTIMTRMAILLQNIQFLHDEWYPMEIPFLWGWKSGWVGGGLLGIGLLVFLAFWLLGKRGKPSKPSMPDPDDQTPAKVASGV